MSSGLLVVDDERIVSTIILYYCTNTGESMDMNQITCAQLDRILASREYTCVLDSHLRASQIPL